MSPAPDVLPDGRFVFRDARPYAGASRLAGYHHFCLNVKDIDATVAELRRREVRIVTEPFELPAINRRLAFLADPFGNLIELAQVLS